MHTHPGQTKTDGSTLKPKAPRADRRRPAGRLAGLVLAVGSLSLIGVSVAPGVARADVPHSGCAAVSVGQSSGWCGLYPGNAVDNTQELGQVSVAADGESVTVQTQDATTGVVPATSFACLTATPSAQIIHRLQNTLCAGSGGIWLPFTGGALTISLLAYPQFLQAVFTIQVAANQDANSSNGDAFYNNISVSTVTNTTSTTIITSA